MATTTKVTRVAAKSSRYTELKKMLEDRRRQLVSEVHGKIRDVRAEGGKEREVFDQGESSEVDIQEDIEFALIQMKAETLNKIDAALRRLEEGSYGNCFECGDEIAEARLRALPFAVRCKDCEEARETAEQRERAMAQRRGASALFFDMSSYELAGRTGPPPEDPRPARGRPSTGRLSSRTPDSPRLPAPNQSARASVLGILLAPHDTT